MKKRRIRHLEVMIAGGKSDIDRLQPCLRCLNVSFTLTSTLTFTLIPFTITITVTLAFTHFTFTADAPYTRNVDVGATPRGVTSCRELPHLPGATAKDGHFDKLISADNALSLSHLALLNFTASTPDYHADLNSTQSPLSIANRSATARQDVH